MKPIRLHFRLALVYFLVAALFGLALRGFGVFDLPGKYRFLVHTHSHIALLGWVYLALTTLIYHAFLHSSSIWARYHRLFLFTQLTLVGMLVSFPFQGYAFWSILFSTLFLLASYGYFAFFLSNSRADQRKAPGFRLVRASLLYMVLSSLGPWALGGIMNTLGPESAWYRLAIYFYLHFQYNGWMVLALAGLGLHLAGKRGIGLLPKRFETGFWLLQSGIVLSFFLSTLWMEPPGVFYVIGGLGALLQLAGFLYIGSALWAGLRQRFNGWAIHRLLVFVLVLFGVKLLLQALSALPAFVTLIAGNIDYIIGYLHLTFLGILTPALWLLGKSQRIIRLPVGGTGVFLLGFVLSELLIFLRGSQGWLNFSIPLDFSQWIFYASLLMVLGILWIIACQWPRSH